MLIATDTKAGSASPPSRSERGRLDFESQRSYSWRQPKKEEQVRVIKLTKKKGQVYKLTEGNEIKRVKLGNPINQKMAPGDSQTMAPANMHKVDRSNVPLPPVAKKQIPASCEAIHNWYDNVGA